MAPGPLAQVLRQLPQAEDPNLLSAAIPFADAGIYRIGEGQALVQSIDFFTPVVDDPRTYGRIAAANAMSDVYAMGARPLTVMNLVGFPPCLDKSVLVEILQGGAEKIAEAGAVLVGGHTVDDDEPKYGLSVTGMVDPEKMVTTVGARPGDALILTKPLGTGILTTAVKAEAVTEEQIGDAVRGMEMLNKNAAEVMLSVGVQACTDVTGFGLLGHAQEMAEASGVRLRIDAGVLPIYPHTQELAQVGLVPQGSYSNREFYLSSVLNADDLPVEIIDLIADPQTSGGLLMVVGEDRREEMVERLTAAGCGAWVIGDIAEGQAGSVEIII